MTDYLAMLPAAERAGVRSTSGLTQFTVGGGASQPAVERLDLPIRLGGRRCVVSVWVVTGSLPLLLSLRSLASLVAVLDVAAGFMKISALGVAVALSLSSAGHLTLNPVTGTGRADASPLHRRPPHSPW